MMPGMWQKTMVYLGLKDDDEGYEYDYDDELDLAEEEYVDEGEGESDAREGEQDEETDYEEDAPPEKQQRMPASMANALSKRRSKVDPAVEAYARLQKDIHDRLIEYLDLRRLDMDRLGDEELWRRTEKAIQDILDQMEAGP